MTKSRDRGSRQGSDPVVIGTTKLATDSGDLKILDTSDNRKKIIASELHIGTSDNQVIIKKGSNNKVQFQTQASGGSAADSNAGGMPVYANISAMTSASATAGDQAYVTANTSIYVNNSNGWYKLATVNTSPTISAPSNNANLTLAEDGSATSIEIVAADVDEGTEILYSFAATTGSLTNIASVTSCATSGGTYTSLAASTNTTNRFFKVTPVTSGAGGSVSLTFSASDTINAATTVQNFTLSFYKYGVKFDGKVATSSPEVAQSIATPSSSDFAFGTGDFTIECWYKIDSTVSTSTYPHLFCNSASASVEAADSGSIVGLYTDGGNNDWFFNWYAGNWQPGGGITGFFNDQFIDHWMHLAFVRISGTTKFYLNGVEERSTSDSTNYTKTHFIIGIARNTQYDWHGWISNFRIVKGTGVYTSAFTPPSSELTAVSGTVLLTCQGNSIADASSSNHTLTATGSPTVAAGKSPYPVQYSNQFWYYNYLQAGSSSDFTLGTGDFTIECWAKWVHASGAGHQGGIWHTGHASGTFHDGSSTPNLQVRWHSASVGFQFMLAGSDYTGSQANSWVQHKWYHLVQERKSGVTKCYVNGTQAHSISDTTDYTTTYMMIGKADGDAFGRYEENPGYISNLRVVKGTAVYDGASSITVPTSDLSAVSGTVLLCCRSSTHDDESSSNHTLTSSHTVAPRIYQSPFN